MSINRALRYGTTVSVLALQIYDKNLKYANKKSPEKFRGIVVKTLFSVQLNRERDQFFSKAVKGTNYFFGLLRTRFGATGCVVP